MTALSRPTNTFRERLAIDGGVNLSDGHARQPLFPAEAEIVANFGHYYGEGKRVAQSKAEARFTSAFFRFSREPTDHPTLLSYSASSLVAVVANWLREREMHVHILEPGFDNIRDLLIRAGVETLPLRNEDLKGLIEDCDGILGQSNMALWLTLPNNPDGFELSEEEFSRLADWCADEGVCLVCDFCFRLFSPEMTGWSQYETLQRSNCSYIAFEDTGKTLPLLDLKIGMLRSSRDAEPELRTLNEEVVLNVSPWMALILSDLLKAYEAEGAERLIWAPTQRRARIVEDWANGMGFTDAGHAGGTAPFKWLHLPHRQLDARTLARLAEANGVHLLPGERFFFNPDHGTRFVRIPLSRSDKVIEAGLQLASAGV